MRIINTEKALELMINTKGKVFSALFTKKDGTDRKMNCRLGVHKHVKGIGMKYDPKDYALLNVFDMQKKGYRMIRLEALKSIQVNKQVYVISDEL